VQARDFYDQAIAMDRHVSGENAICNGNHAKTILNRGNMAMKLGRLKEAKEWLEHARDLFYQLNGGEDAKSADIAVVLCSLANLLRCQKDYEESGNIFNKALEMLYELFGPDARNAYIAEALHSMSLLARDRKHYGVAKAYHEKALQMMVAIMGTESSRHPLVHNIAHELIKMEQSCAMHEAMHEKAGKGMCWIPGRGIGGNRNRKSKEG
jgi:tetratricopeptide (TPR) repeat protein